MSRNKKQTENPWSRTFGDDENLKNRQFSRSARNYEKKDAAPITKILVVFFLLIFITPIVYTMVIDRNSATKPASNQSVLISKANQSEKDEQNNDSEANADDSESDKEDTTTDETKTEDEADKATDDSQKESEETATNDSQSDQGSTDAADQSSTDTNTEDQSSNQPNDQSNDQSNQTDQGTTDSTDTAGFGSYTVQAGDNLYRIAVNHGMTLDELKQVNGLSSNDAVIGMQLKVKQ